MKKSLLIAAALLVCSLAATAQPPPETEAIHIGQKVDAKKMGASDVNEAVGSASIKTSAKFDTIGAVASGPVASIVDIKQVGVAGAVHDVHAGLGANSVVGGFDRGDLMTAFFKTTTGGAGAFGLMNTRHGLIRT